MKPDENDLERAVRAAILEKHQIISERDSLLAQVHSQERKLAECDLRIAALNRKRSGAFSPSVTDSVDDFDGVGSWTTRRPTEPGDFWYREDRKSKPVVVEVIVKKNRLYATPPTHIEPVPLSEVDGEWSVLLVGPPR